jgi:hypothetical protein
MTQAIQKQSIQPSWSVLQMQDHIVKMIVNKIQMRIKMEDAGKIPDMAELEKATALNKADCMKKAGVNSPLELVKRLAELTVNMTGSKVSIAGADSQATLIYEEPKVWLEAKKVLSDSQQKKMSDQFQTWMKSLGDAFGYDTKVEFGCEPGDCAKITFAKH